MPKLGVCKLTAGVHLRFASVLLRAAVVRLSLLDQ